MITLDVILNELKNVPVGRLEDLYAIIHSLKADAIPSSANRKKILSFANIFSSMTEKEYHEYLQETKSVRKDMFDRDIDL